MKKSLLIVLFIFSLLPGIQFAQGTFEKGSEYCSQKKINSTLSDAPVEITADIKHSYNVLNYELNLDLYNCFVSPYLKSFKGFEIITFQVDSTLNYIKLNALTSSLTIDSVSMAGVSFTHTSNVLTVNLNRSYNPGETTDVKIYYRHNNVSDGAFYVSGGFVFTDSEPEGARRWFPSWDRPSDKATSDLTVKVPASVKLGSNGVLLIRLWTVIHFIITGSVPILLLPT